MHTCLQNLLLDDGIYVTLVGPQRYGGEGKVSVGTAFNAQISSGIRKGLGFIGAGKQVSQDVCTCVHIYIYIYVRV